MNPRGNWINLQLFAQEKTEPATPKKRQEARRRGQATKSSEITAVAVLLAVAFVLRGNGSEMSRRVVVVATQYWGQLFRPEFGPREALTMGGELSWVVGQALLPVLAAAGLVGLVVEMAQTGFLLTFTPLFPNFSRLDPLGGMGRLFSRRSGVELLKAMGKALVVGFVLYQGLSRRWDKIAGLVLADPRAGMAAVGETALQLLFNAGLAMVVLALADYYFQRVDLEGQLRMTKQEVKDEVRETETNPQMKAKIRERQRRLGRMIRAVAKADVVVTNPTHYAVALRYDPKADAAPVVVAKGKDLLAQRIKEEARKHQVTMVENPVLAQALYASVEIGQIIPEKLYQAVAEVLAYVWRVKRKAL
ncbi:MAG: flagellar biosynthesis protein FlhB [Firmicutes bacterium]|nr:flagellar biosynthesis protein FlhB [Bacillota bacterium]MCL5039509.1 flagellar biosynthesis protein FlhB [Bacillota bacterium]